MKKINCLFMLFFLAFSLSACGKKEESGLWGFLGKQEAEEVIDIEEYISLYEEMNDYTITPVVLSGESRQGLLYELDKNNPLGSLQYAYPLSMEIFPEEYLAIRYRAGDVNISEDKDTSSITLNAADSSWVLYFQPFSASEKAEILNHIEATELNGTDYINYSTESITFKGLETKVYARNVSPEVIDILDPKARPEAGLFMEYEGVSGRWAGLWIYVVPGAVYSDANIYDIFYDDYVKEIIQGFDFRLTGPDNRLITDNFTMDFPRNWEIIMTDTDEKSGTMNVSVNFETDTAIGSLYISQAKEGSANTLVADSEEILMFDFGDLQYTGVFSYGNSSKETVPVEKLILVSESIVPVEVVVELIGADESAYLSFLNTGVMEEVMGSVRGL